MSAIETMTLTLRLPHEAPTEPGHYIAYDAYRSPRAAFWTPDRGWRNGDGTPFRHMTGFLGPIPERDPQTRQLRWPDLPPASEP